MNHTRARAARAHTARICLSLAMAVAVAVVAGCATGSSVAERHPAARTIQELLELRRHDVRDPKAYRKYFEESALATALAEGSVEPTGTPSVPQWQPPYASAVTSSTASVVVVWKPSADFPDWPAVNVFSLKLDKGRWLLVDAVEATSAPEPIKADASR